MKINQRERKLLFVLSFLLWLWALRGTIALYHNLQEVKGELQGAVPSATEQKMSSEPAGLYLSRLLALEGRGLPGPFEMAGVNLLDYLREQTLGAGLSLERMSLETPEKVGAHRRLAAQLELTGRGENFVAFLHRLALGQYACNVTGLELAAGEGQLRGRIGLEFFLLDAKALARTKQDLLGLGAKATVEREIQPLAYYFPQGFGRAFLLKPKATFEETQLPESIPWPVEPAPLPAPEEPIPPRPPEPYRPPYQLRGIVFQEDKPMALLAGPGGQILVVGEGAKLDLEQVVRIERRRVLLRRGSQEAWLEVTP